MAKKISQITAEESTSLSDTDWMEGEEAGGTSFRVAFSVIKSTIATYLASLAQTLTNKTINLSSNTLTGTTAEFNTALSDANFATLAGTETLTNKRVTRRSVTVTVAATPAINTDNGDIFRIGVAGDLLDLAVTSLTTNLTGTPTHGQMIIVEWLDDGTSRAITHGASFRAGVGFALLTATTINKLHRELFQWDSADSKWDKVGNWVEA